MSARGQRYRKSKGVDSDALEATPENLRIEIDHVFSAFIADPGKTEYVFTSELTNLQRKYIHNKARLFNIISKSSGKPPNRTLCLKKCSVGTHIKPIAINVSDELKQKIHEIIADEAIDSSQSSTAITRGQWASMFDNGPPVPEVHYVHYCICAYRQSLPIYAQRQKIVKSFEDNFLTVLCAETGSGKTTQVPQYIIEECAALKKKCRIICTQPRRIAAIAAADRVAVERSESLGSSVGYIVRLQQKCTANTNIIFCTTGIFLRQLMTSFDTLNNITHVIIDEIHERDKDTDFILTCLKTSLTEYPHLKIILMSATFNAEFFTNYFSGGKTLSIPGRQYKIETYFLPDILLHFQYMSSQMTKLKLDDEKGNELEALILSDGTCSQADVDQVLDNYRDKNNEEFDPVEQFIYYVEKEQLHVDTPHSKTGQTALMLAISNNLDMNFIRFLLDSGADLTKTCNAGRTALDYAPEDFQKVIQSLKIETDQKKIEKETQTHRNKLQRFYEQSFNSDVDFDLIVAIIKPILTNCTQQGAILIFLPGYEDIMICSDYITSEIPNDRMYTLFLLHSSINIQQQSDVFKPLVGRRKIILSTNIAETSITIDDVMYVIDTGKVKEKSYDYFANASSLQTVWVSQASAEQRRGRAGRTGPGVCYRLYTETRFKSMDKEKAPEMLRVSLEELCLHVKVIAPPRQGIADFLEMAPSPPLRNRVDFAIENLVSLGALDAYENLTNLGDYLSVLPLEPHLGKIVISSVILRCLNPILILTAAMTNQDMFTLPQKQNLKAVAEDKKKQLINGVWSDHIAYLEAVDMWKNNERLCKDFFINKNTIPLIMAVKDQVLRQLVRLGFLESETDLKESNVNCKSWPAVKAALSTGLFPNVATQNKLPHWVVKDSRKVTIPKSSACSNSSRDMLLVYDEVFSYRQLTAKNVTAVTPITIALTCGNLIVLNESEFQLNWMKFRCWNNDFIQFRQLYEKVVRKVINDPKYRKYNKKDNDIINMVIYILEEEESIKKLKRPVVMPCSLSHQRSSPAYWSKYSNRGSPRNQSKASFSREDDSRAGFSRDESYEGSSRGHSSHRGFSRRGHTNGGFSRNNPDEGSSRGYHSKRGLSRGHYSNAASSQDYSNEGSSRGNHSNDGYSRGDYHKTESSRGNSWRGRNIYSKRRGRGRGANEKFD